MQIELNAIQNDEVMAECERICALNGWSGLAQLGLPELNALCEDMCKVSCKTPEAHGAALVRYLSNTYTRMKAQQDFSEKVIKALLFSAVFCISKNVMQDTGRYDWDGFYTAIQTIAVIKRDLQPADGVEGLD